MQTAQYTQAVAGLGDAFPGSAGPFVTPGTSPYQRSGSAASLASFGANTEVVQAQPVPLPNPAKEIADQAEKAKDSWGGFTKIVSTAAGMAGAYHGYKRNKGSVGWAVGWTILAGLFWPIAVPIMVAQGFGKPAEMKPNAAKRKKKKLKFGEGMVRCPACGAVDTHRCDVCKGWGMISVARAKRMGVRTR